MSSFFKTIAEGFYSALKQNMESFINLETAVDDVTLAANDGSLVSVLKIKGSRRIIGDAEYREIVSDATLKLGTKFDQPGYALQVYFSRDPFSSLRDVERLIEPSKNTIQNINLNMEDVLEEKTKHISNYLVHEDIFFVLWTRPSSLTPSESEHAKKEAMNKEWVHAEKSQFPHSGFEALHTKHSSYVNAIVSSLKEMEIDSYVLDSHRAIQEVRGSIYPYRKNEDWKPNLPGDKIRPRQLSEKFDYSELLWPSLRSQICVDGAENISKENAKIGKNIWSGVDMTLAPITPSPFPVLLRRLTEQNVPFRISFLIESGGSAGLQMRKFLAGILGFSNASNKLLKDSIEWLTDLAQSEPVVRLRVSLATWAPEGEDELLEERVSSLIQSVESWGYCQVSQITGDPLACIMSSALGIACASTAPAAIAPFYDVMKLLPWQRPASPFENGSMLLRTTDGRVFPYQTGSALTTTWFDLVFAQPGAGKSVLMNSMNLSTCLQAGNAKLPFVAIIDIGPSSAGLISMIKDALPPERRHEAAHYRLKMTEDYAVNPFDTQLGCRTPLPQERSFLISLLSLICTPPGQNKPYDGIADLAELVVDEMYRWRSDQGSNIEPRPYMPKVDDDIDRALLEHNVILSEKNVYWWDVVDAFFEKGLYNFAILAQRYASPILTDAIIASRRPQIKDLLQGTTIGSSSEDVIHAFERMISSAIKEYGILSSITKFDVANARVCSLDLGDVCPQGDETADKQTAIMYMMARQTLIKNWWIGEDLLKFFPEKYLDYHKARVKEVKETPKRICYDEFHRTSKSTEVRAQVIRDVREGRKWGVQIILASQLLADFSDDMIDLATGVWILGAAASEVATVKAAEVFGLSETSTWIMKHRLTGPTAAGAPGLMVLATNEGKYEQFLMNTLGPIELWALSTSAEDVVLRNQLYERLGAVKARKVLAINFPGGSCRKEISRRVTIYTEKGELEKAKVPSVIQEIAEELISYSLTNLNEV